MFSIWVELMVISVFYGLRLWHTDALDLSCPALLHFDCMPYRVVEVVHGVDGLNPGFSLDLRFCYVFLRSSGLQFLMF